VESGVCDLVERTPGSTMLGFSRMASSTTLYSLSILHSALYQIGMCNNCCNVAQQHFADTVV
jgi:hypothetical protein